MISPELEAVLIRAARAISILCGVAIVCIPYMAYHIHSIKQELSKRVQG